MNITQGKKFILLKRTSLDFVNKTLEKNQNWKILDVGCGYRASNHATVVADIKDFSDLYKKKIFVKITDKKLPFKDKVFDFVIASHVIEHVEDFEFFIKELERISSKGYIELPSRLGDNLVFENKTDHIWWCLYDDIEKKIVVAKRNQIIDPFINVSTAKILEQSFRESFVIELMWENRIDYKIDDSIRQNNFKKITFFQLVKKYMSKKIRSFYK